MITVKQLNEELEKFLEMYGDYGNAYNRDINRLLRMNRTLKEIYQFIKSRYPKLSKRNILDEIRLSALDYESSKFFEKNKVSEMPDDIYAEMIKGVDSQIADIDKEK